MTDAPERYLARTHYKFQHVVKQTNICNALNWLTSDGLMMPEMLR